MFEDAVLIALGSSLAADFGSREVLLQAALDNFPAVGLRLVERSAWWRSASWPDPDLPDYLNGLAVVETGLSPRQTLAALARIEAAFGRRHDAPNAPRTLDLDLIAHGRTVLDEPGLVLPHPRAHERLFVMGPLAEIAPDWRHPVTGESARELARKARIGADARPV